MVLVTPTNKNESRTGEKIPHKMYQVPIDPDFIEQIVVKTAIEEGMLKAIFHMVDVQRVACDHLLNNTKLLQDLRNFDLIVYEGAALCTVLVADLLGIPRVVIFPVSPNVASSSYFKIPLPVSYVPSQMTTFTSKMSFIQRLGNLGAYVISQLLSHAMLSSMSPLKDKYNITPGISYHDAIGNVELLIIEADFALEYPQPLLPGLFLIYSGTSIQ